MLVDVARYCPQYERPFVALLIIGTNKGRGNEAEYRIYKGSSSLGRMKFREFVKRDSFPSGLDADSMLQTSKKNRRV